MSEFQIEIDNRVRAALASLEQARREADDYLIDIRLGELESLQRLAHDNDVQVQLPQDTLIDLRDSTSQASPSR